MSHLLEDFKAFLDQSPTSWHAAQEIGNRLALVDFTPLEETKTWKLEAGRRYFIQRDGFVCAFNLPKTSPKKMIILASHTDSPALKLKPQAEIQKDGITLFETDTYGSPILNSWFNRDLALAGQVIFQNAQGKIEDTLVFLDSTPLFIPQLPPHLDKDSKEKGVIIDKQEHLRAIFSFQPAQKNTLETLLKKHLGLTSLLSYDLFLVPLEKARFAGLNNDMISSYRLDNLTSCHACSAAIASTPIGDNLQIAIFWDHEEIGSHTQNGALSPTLTDILKRIALSLSLSEEEMIRLKTDSLCISVDVSHAFNPNFTSKFDPEHKCLLGQGVVLKYNADKKYATDAKTAAIIRQVCQQEGLLCQSFAPHSNVSCGSTVGPIVTQTLGIPTVDIGCPILSMHAIRETMATQDHLDMFKLLTRLLQL